MNAKQLIEMNNQKREMLTPENEEYYSDLLLYIRLQFTLSEQQSEEILMEMLDHLLDGQDEGKTASEIFGHDPKAYADELIQQLPQEKKRDMLSFAGSLFLQLIGYFFLIDGVVLFFAHWYKEVDTAFYPISSLITIGIIAIFISLNIWFIFQSIKRTLFPPRNNKMQMLLVGAFAASSMALVIIIGRILPDIGPSISVTWPFYVWTGAIILLLSFAVKKFTNT